MSALQKGSVWVDRFEFSGFHGCRSCCSLRIERLSDRRTVVICTELEDNPGTSVTNSAEILATLIVNQRAIDPRQLVWIEHYPPGRIHGKREDWDIVTFGRMIQHGTGWMLADPSWRPMRPEDWTVVGIDPSAIL